MVVPTLEDAAQGRSFVLVPFELVVAARKAVQHVRAHVDRVLPRGENRVHHGGRGMAGTRVPHLRQHVPVLPPVHLAVERLEARSIDKVAFVEHVRLDVGLEGSVRQLHDSWCDGLRHGDPPMMIKVYCAQDV